MLLLISVVCVYIAQRLQHASATLPGSATPPQFFTDRFPHAHICLPLSTIFSDLSGPNGVFICLVYLIWEEQNFNGSLSIISLQLSPSCFCFKFENTTHLSARDKSESLLSNSSPHGGAPQCPIVVEVHRAPPVAAKRSAPHPFPLSSRQCWWCPLTL